MAEYLKFRSQVTSVCDYHTIDLAEYVPAFTPDEAELERDLKRQRNRHGFQKECDCVEMGDLVTLSCRSENAKFCKTDLIIPVGSGLFHMGLEKQLVGQVKNKDAELMVDGETISVRIKKIVRTILPELTDEAVRGWKMPGVESVADLKKYCINRQIDKMLDDSENADAAAARIWTAVGEKSSFVLDEDEAMAVIALSDMQETAVVSERADADAMSDDEEIAEETVETDEEFAALRLKLCRIQLQMAVIGQKMAEDVGELLTQEDYENYLERYREAYPEASEKDIERTWPQLKFMLDQYGDRMAIALDQYVLSYFKEHLNP